MDRTPMKPRRLALPLSAAVVETLRAGDELLLTGTLYVARDAAHKRMTEALSRGEQLAVDLTGQAIYFMGPTPARPGRPIGSAGPTSSYRMDAYTPALMEKGLRATIGKGPRSREVKEALKLFRAVYLGAIGGAGALISRCIKEVECVAYDDLGPEALRRIVVEDFPVTVINDIHGGDMYDEGRRRYRRAAPASPTVPETNTTPSP